MSRSRTSIDVSAHLIEPPSPPPRAGDDAPEPIDWAALFGNEAPVEFEVGSGKGLFLANAARAHPDRNFLGVEIARKFARLAAERLAKQGLANARIWAADVRQVMSRIPGGSLHAVHVYFPDPWWKKRHKKRRVFNEGLVAEIERTLRPGGELHVASDVEEYFLVIRERIAANKRFRERPVPELGTPEHELDYLTNFERKYRLEGRPIHRAAYDLAEPPATMGSSGSTPTPDRAVPS